MAKADWVKLAAQFEHDHARYGTGAKEWCEAKGINYQSARRYIKVRKSAQEDCAQKGNAQGKNAHLAHVKRKTVKRVTKGKTREKKACTEISNVVSIDDVKLALHDTNSIPHPERKGGMYARYFPAEKRYMFDAADMATLDDELMLTRARLQSGIEYLGKIHADMAQASTMEERISLYESFNRCNSGLDTLTARIESLTKTMSSLGIDVVMKEKVIADTARIRNMSRKLFLEADNLAKEGKGDDTPISEMLDDLQNIGTGGLMC